jgi:hypothetical protein
LVQIPFKYIYTTFKLFKHNQYIKMGALSCKIKYMETTNHPIQPGTSPDEDTRIIEEMQQQMNPTNKDIDKELQEAYERRIALSQAQVNNPEPSEPVQDNPATTNQEPQSQ